MTSPDAHRHIALALSGGGTRAMAFHAGVLRYIAQENRMESISHLSTVSGGSLLVGLIYAKAEMNWPTSQQYIATIHPFIRHTLVNRNLAWSAIKRLVLRPSNWQYGLSRANVMAQTIREIWHINGTLADIAATPEWSINGTTAETGKRFRFKAERFGDYELGYTAAPDFPLAQAMAISAAFPIGIGPLAIDMHQYQWYKRPAWDAPIDSEELIDPPYEKLHIYDGGLYDNLGLEPLHDMGKRQSKVPALLVASDASAPLERGFMLGSLSPFRVKRLLDVVTDQNRALRVRAFFNFLQQEKTGAYLPIGSALHTELHENRQLSSAHEWLPKESIKSAHCYPTSLWKMKAEDFDLIERHGFETAYSSQLMKPFLI